MNKTLRQNKAIWLNMWFIISFVALLACGDTTPAPNQDPQILDVGFPLEVNPGDVVKITAIATDPDGDDTLLTYKWSIFSGGGTFEPEESLTIPSTIYIAPEEIRVHQLKIEVIDVEGATDTHVFSVRVVEDKSKE